MTDGIIIAVLLVLSACIIRYWIKRRKRGIRGCGCAGCSEAGSCRKKDAIDNEGQ